MRQVTTVFLLALTPFLLATVVLEPEDDQPKTDEEKRADLALFVHHLDGVIDSQIDEIVALDPTRNVAELRKSHYEWRLERDLRCAEKGLAESDRVAELECRAQAGEKYYQDRELEIAELEEKLDSE